MHIMQIIVWQAYLYSTYVRIRTIEYSMPNCILPNHDNKEHIVICGVYRLFPPSLSQSF